jgi:hypothetical protein
MLPAMFEFSAKRFECNDDIEDLKNKRAFFSSKA